MKKIKRDIRIFHVFNDWIEKQNVLFIRSNDKVFGFGFNYFGCCGLGHNSVVNEPQIIPELCHKNIQQFFIGFQFVLGLTSDKQVYGWGHNDRGQLGRGYVTGKEEYLKPEIIDFPFESVIQLSCGLRHSLALSCGGRVYGWGSNVDGRIGCGSKEGFFLNPICLEKFIPFSVKLLRASFFRSYALTTDGLVYSWGSNHNCCLGHDSDEDVYEPRLIENIPKIRSFCVSDGNTYLLTNESDLYFCGVYYDNKNKRLYQKTPKLLKKEKKLSSLHIIPNSYQGVAALCENDIHGLHKNELRKYDYSSYFDLFSIKHELCYKTIHINSGIIFDGNDLNDLQNYKVFKSMFDTEELGFGGFGTVFKAKNKYDHQEFAIKKIPFEGKLFSCSFVILIEKFN